MIMAKKGTQKEKSSSGSKENKEQESAEFSALFFVLSIYFSNLKQKKTWLKKCKG